MICQVKCDALFFVTTNTRHDKYFSICVIKIDDTTASMAEELPAGNDGYEPKPIPIP